MEKYIKRVKLTSSYKDAGKRLELNKQKSYLYLPQISRIFFLI
ncbi:unnamed protein product, partial [marine sediment metagenome]